MPIDNCLPVHKSTHREINTCAYHFDARVNRGIPEPQRPAGAKGQTLHGLRAQVLSEAVTFDEALKGQQEEIQTALTKIIAFEPTEPNVLFRDFEVEIALAWDGRLLTDSAIASCGLMFMGTLDDVQVTTNNGLLVTDLKTGRIKTDDSFERNGYALAAHAKYGLTTVRFRYFYSETGDFQDWTYNFGGLYSPDGIVFVTNPRGEKEERPHWLAAFRQEIEDTAAKDPIPTPGDHCGAWYGEPCHLMGTHCPAYGAQDLPEIWGKEDSSRALIRALASDQHVEILPLMMDHAWGLTAHAKGIIKKIEDKLKAASKQMQRPIRSGSGLYAYWPDPKTEIDAEKVITIMLNAGCSPAQIAASVNISNTSLKFAKGVPAAVREQIQREAVKELEPKEKWGKKKADGTNADIF